MSTVMQQQDSPRLSLKQVAQRLGLSYKTVWRMAIEGRLPAKKIGKQWRIKPEDLEEDIKSPEHQEK